MSRLICIPAQVRTFQEGIPLVNRAKKADFVEIWFDKATEPAKIRALIKAAEKTPVIVVCRSKREGGKYKGSEKDRIEILKHAIVGGAKFVDIGQHTNKNLKNSLRAVCKKFHAKMILSLHLWDKTPSRAHFIALFEKLKREKPDIIKIATHLRTWSDSVTLFELATYAHKTRMPYIITGMGSKSRIARIGCLLLGGYLTYAALDEKHRTAPGQPTYEELRKLLNPSTGSG